jgi:hypothetical protein
VADLKISGGDISCTAGGVAIGAAASGSTVSGELTISGGKVTTSCSSGPAIGSTGSGVSQIKISGGTHELKVVGGLNQPVIAFAISSQAGKSVRIADSTIVAQGGNFIARDGTPISDLLFEGVVHITFTRLSGTTTNALCYVPSNGVFVAAGASFTAVTPVRFFSNELTPPSSNRPSVAFIYPSKATERDGVNPPVIITFGSNIVNKAMDLVLKGSPGNTALVVTPTTNTKIVIGGQTTGSYEVLYYEHATGENGVLCSANHNPPCQWGAEGSNVEVDLTYKGSTAANPTKSQSPVPATTINPATHQFTSINLPYRRRRRFRRITSIVIALIA